MNEETRVSTTVLMWFLGLWGAGGIWVGTIQVQVLSLINRMDKKSAEISEESKDVDARFREHEKHVQQQIQLLNVSINMVQTQIQEAKTDIAKEYVSKTEMDKVTTRVVKQLEDVSEKLTDVTVQLARIAGAPTARRRTNHGKSRS